MTLKVDFDFIFFKGFVNLFLEPSFCKKKSNTVNPHKRDKISVPPALNAF